MSFAPYAWMVTYDHLDHKPVKIFGPRNINPQLQTALTDAAKRGRKASPDNPGDNDPEWFKMADDDGEVYYTGLRVGESDEDGFEPLDDYGTPNAGCTEIRYRKIVEGKEAWEML